MIIVMMMIIIIIITVIIISNNINTFNRKMYDFLFQRKWAGVQLNSFVDGKFIILGN